ncbi:hypothetical protein WICPIJ_008702, partial [Wickerhamomyces pijperi]
SSWFGSLDFDLSAVELQISTDADLVYSFWRVKSHKPEPSGLTGVLVQHQLGIDDLTELREERLKLVRSYFRSNTTNEDLTSLVLFFSWNGSLWINNLTIKDMLGLQHFIDGLLSGESQKPKPSGTTIGVSHDRVINHLTEVAALAGAGPDGAAGVEGAARAASGVEDSLSIVTEEVDGSSFLTSAVASSFLTAGTVTSSFAFVSSVEEEETLVSSSSPYKSSNKASSSDNDIVGIL